MATEIERKFKLVSDDWKQHISGKKNIRQGYLQSGIKKDQLSSVRVRISNNQATLNIKSAEMSIERTEYEYAIPLEDAEHIMSALCEGAVIEKTRYLVQDHDHLWEIDIFGGDNSGLQMAEVELEAINEPLFLPDWVGDEVSDDPRYYNNYLINCPFKGW